MSENTSQPKKGHVLSNILKIVAAIVLLLGMVLAMGVTVIKDSRKNPAYCATCHTDPYYTGWANTDSYQLAHSHSEMGISCQTCHDRTLAESLEEWKAYIVGFELPLEEREYSNDTCFTCHESYENVIPLTTVEILGSERNPHDGHWGELDCGTCHNMHRDSVDYCAGCHARVTDAPGWIKGTGE